MYGLGFRDITPKLRTKLARTCNMKRQLLCVYNLGLIIWGQKNPLQGSRELVSITSIRPLIKGFYIWGRRLGYSSGR